MKSIETFFNEELSFKISNKTKREFSEFLYNILYNTKIPKDNIISMLNNMDLDFIYSFQNYIKEIDPENSIQYISDDDLFIQDTNKTKIIDLLAEYIYKFIVNF